MKIFIYCPQISFTIKVKNAILMQCYIKGVTLSRLEYKIIATVIDWIIIPSLDTSGPNLQQR